MFSTFVRDWAFVLIHDDLVGWPHQLFGVRITSCGK